MRWLLGVPALAFAVFGVACVGGDDKSDAATQGSLGGPCFANNTCNSGLVCVLENGKGICEQSDATTQDAPADVVADTTTTDAPSDVTTSDVGSDVVDAGCNAQITVPCANQQCHQGGKSCCEKQGTCGVTSADCNGTPLWDCTGTSDCNANYVCCVTGQLDNTSCPYGLTSATQAVCVAQLCGGGYQLCASSTDCSGNMTCHPTSVDGHVFGICAP